MSFPSRPPPARAAYRGFVKGGQSERVAGEEPIPVRSMPALYAKDEDDAEDAITVVKTVEKEEKKKTHSPSPSQHGRESKSHNKGRHEKKKEDKKDKERDQGSRDQGIRGQSGKDLGSKNILPAAPRGERVQGGRDPASKDKGGRDRSRSPVGRGGAKEAGQLREEARMGFNVGRKLQIPQSRAKEGETEREKPTERGRGKWEGFGWSSRNRGEELGQVSDDSDD